jgi:hypothetical protein
MSRQVQLIFQAPQLSPTSELRLGKVDTVPTCQRLQMLKVRF